MLEPGAPCLPNYAMLIKFMPDARPTCDHADDWFFRRLQISEAMGRGNSRRPRAAIQGFPYANSLQVNEQGAMGRGVFTKPSSLH